MIAWAKSVQSTRTRRRTLARGCLRRRRAGRGGSGHRRSGSRPPRWRCGPVAGRAGGGPLRLGLVVVSLRRRRRPSSGYSPLFVRRRGRLRRGTSVGLGPAWSSDSSTHLGGERGWRPPCLRANARMSSRLALYVSASANPSAVSSGSPTAARTDLRISAASARSSDAAQGLQLLRDLWIRHWRSSRVGRETDWSRVFARADRADCLATLSRRRAPTPWPDGGGRRRSPPCQPRPSRPGW